MLDDEEMCKCMPTVACGDLFKSADLWAVLNPLDCWVVALGIGPFFIDAGQIHHSCGKSFELPSLHYERRNKSKSSIRTFWKSNIVKKQTKKQKLRNASTTSPAICISFETIVWGTSFLSGSWNMHSYASHPLNSEKGFLSIFSITTFLASRTLLLGSISPRYSQENTKISADGPTAPSNVVFPGV